MKNSFRNKVILMVFMLLLPTVVYASSFKYNYRGVSFTCRVKDGKVSIMSFDRNASKVIIPASVVDPSGRTIPVYAINLYNEIMNYKTREVLIDKGIVEIKRACFVRFSDLNIVYIPSTIEKIEKNAFNSRHLPTFKMPSSISEEDLKKGLAVYPKQQVIGGFQDIDLADYSEYAAENGSAEDADNAETMLSNKSKGIAAGTSDVDYNIPNSSVHRENTFCVIIANEKYSKAPLVEYAATDGATFKKYCTNTLGIPEDNIRMTTNANYLKMQEQFDWLQKVAQVFGDDANFIVYYAGHGVPSDEGSCFLLPVDGDPAKSNNGYSLRKLYDMLGQITTQSALVLIDACFSGNDRNDVSMLGSDRGAVRKLKEETVGGNVIVMSAASNTETALPYEEKGHGMFTYFLLKKLQETKGKVKYGELYDYIRKQVSRRSTVSKSKTQTPSITYSGNIAGGWENMTF